MHPSPIVVWAMVLPAVLSVSTIFRPELVWPVVGIDALLAFVLAFDWFLTRKDQVEVASEHREIFSIGQPNAIVLRARTRSRPRSTIRVRSDFPLSFRTPELPVAMELAGNTWSEAVHHVYPTERGLHRLGDHFVRFGSRLGLWVVQRRIESRRDVRVYPDLASIRTYEMLARQHRQYALVRASALRGGESEFARLRDYTSDDDYRFVDWKATARRNKLTSREYQLESDQNVFFLLDAGRLMTAEVDGMTHFDHALNSALLMAHVASRGGDRVGCMCFDESVRTFVFPSGGPKATSRLVQATYAVHPRMTESAFDEALSSFDTRMKQRSLLVLFTQLLDDVTVDRLAAQLQHLGRRHLPLVVLLEDTDLSERAEGEVVVDSTREDLFRRGAAAELLRWKAQATGRLKKTGALVLECPADDLSNRVINRYLELKARHAL